MYSKFFDNQEPLPHHIHHDEVAAARVGQRGKPEAYYFPPQVNNHGGDFPYTFFGFEPGTTKEQVKQCLENFTKGDNEITNLSRAYRLKPGTGWNVPAGVLHAPGSLCTYEPQAASDVYAMYQSVIQNRRVVPEELLWKDTPEDRQGNFDYLVEVIDWEKNVDPNFVQTNVITPILRGGALHRFNAPPLARLCGGIPHEASNAWKNPHFFFQSLENSIAYPAMFFRQAEPAPDGFPNLGNVESDL